jgi:hypothetical protein
MYDRIAFMKTSPCKKRADSFWLGLPHSTVLLELTGKRSLFISKFRYNLVLTQFHQNLALETHKCQGPNDVSPYVPVLKKLATEMAPFLVCIFQRSDRSLDLGELPTASKSAQGRAKPFGRQAPPACKTNVAAG